MKQKSNLASKLAAVMLSFGMFITSASPAYAEEDILKPKHDSETAYTEALQANAKAAAELDAAKKALAEAKEAEAKASADASAAAESADAAKKAAEDELEKRTEGCSCSC